jgi:hypothetical protein
MHGKAMPERDAIGLALLYAYVRGQRQAVDFLLEKIPRFPVMMEAVAQRFPFRRRVKY